MSDKCFLCNNDLSNETRVYEFEQLCACQGPIKIHHACWIYNTPSNCNICSNKIIKNGLEILYSPGGIRMLESHYLNGEFTVNYKKYDNSGQLSVEMTTIPDPENPERLIGTLKEYNSTGQIIIEENYINKKLCAVKSFDSEDNVVRQQSF